MGQLDMVGRERREKGREGEVDDKVRNKERERMMRIRVMKRVKMQGITQTNDDCELRKMIMMIRMKIKNKVN